MITKKVLLHPLNPKSLKIVLARYSFTIIPKRMILGRYEGLNLIEKIRLVKKNCFLSIVDIPVTRLVERKEDSSNSLLNLPVSSISEAQHK